MACRPATAHRGPMGPRLAAPIALCIAAVALATSVEPPPPPTYAGPWGARILPDGDGWALRWQGEGPVAVDGRPTAGPPLRLAAGRVTLGSTVIDVPPRPGPCAPLRFVALGDGRAAVDGVGPSAYWPGMLGEALALAPAFVLNTGDLVKNGEDPAEWPAYLASLPPWPPMIAVRGNHDRGPLFYAFGLAPGPTFGHRMGPVFVAGLDTQLGADDLPAALAALDARLAGPEAARATWRVLALHRPIWSRGNHGSDEHRVNRLLVPFIDRHRFDVVFAGHDHHYERFCPSVGHGPDRRCVAPGEGTVYVVTGGAATFTNPVPGVSQKVDPAVAAVDAEHSRIYSGSKHVVLVEAGADALRLTAHRTRTGNLRPAAVIDRFEAPRRRPRPAECR